MRYNFHLYKITLHLFFLLIALSSNSQIYKNKALPIDQRVEDLLKQMTLEEKVQQVTGKGFDTRPNERLGIPSLLLADGPLGVRSGKSTAFPSGVSMGATWDTTLIWNIGKALGEETKAKGLNCLLGPCVNIHRSAYGGRNFESFSEDPYLSSRLAVVYVKGLQSTGVSSSVKHYAGNEYEWERSIANTVADKRTMEEIYYPPFKAAIKEADAWTVMCGYNKFNGVYCCENEVLLNQVLKKDWGFKGLVVSDWGATHSTIASAKNGLDLEMPDGQYFGKSLLEAVKKGEVSEKDLDEMVRRNLYVLYKTGLMDAPMKKDTSHINSPLHRSLAAEGARKSIVLLKNENNVLPIKKDNIKKIAVIGPAAAIAIIGGGGSSQVTPVNALTSYETIKKRVGKGVQVEYKIGDTNALDMVSIREIPSKFLFTDSKKQINGIKGEYFNNVKLEGKPDAIRIDKNVNFDFGTDPPHKEISANRFSVRWSGKLLAPATRNYRFDLICDDGAKVYIDNKLLISDWNNGAPRLNSGHIKLQANKVYDIKVEYFDNELGAICQIGWNYVENEELKPGNMQDAITLAKSSDVALVFVGFSARYEKEGYDKPLDLKLPNDQNKLINAIAEVNPNTIVVFYSGTSIIMEPWLNKVKGIICAWYPGEAGADAVADILFGMVNPSGKLPVSFPADTNNLPGYNGYKPKDLNVIYKEGIFIGYRHFDKYKKAPLFPFGHGLSYTTFEYSDLKTTLSPNETMVSFNLKNTGNIEGEEVAQVYVKDVASSVDRPEKELKSFGRIKLKPGESKEISFKLNNSNAYSFYDTKTEKFIVEPGTFEILVGSSSRDIKIKKEVEIK